VQVDFFSLQNLYPTNLSLTLRRGVRLCDTTIGAGYETAFRTDIFLVCVEKVKPLEDVFTGKKWYNERMKRDYLERQSYPTDLTDEQWAAIEPLFVGMREYKHSKRELTNAVLYLVNSGCKWRQLPHDFPPHFTVHSFYRRARLSGLWDRILEHLVKMTRKNAGREENPTYAIVDSQSVKTTYASDQRGFDGEKNKRQKASHSNRYIGMSFERSRSQGKFE